MAQQIEIASLFAEIGIKFDRRSLKSLNTFQKRLGTLKKQLTGINKLTKIRFQRVDGIGHLTEAKKRLMDLNKEISKVKQNSKINISTRGKYGASTGGGRGGSGGFFPVATGTAAGRLGSSALGGGAGFLAARSVFGAGNELVGIKNALTAATGDIGAGAKEYEFLKNTVDELGISMTATARSYTNILATTKAVGSASFGMDDARELFVSTAEAARVLNLSADDQAGVLRAMNQMLSKGTVMAEELKGQLGERLPGAIGLASKALGVGTEELFDMLENGEVLAADLLPKLSKELQKFSRSGGALELAKQSPAAALARFQNAAFFAQTQFGAGGFNQQLGSGFTALADALKSNLDEIKEMGGWFAVLSGTMEVFWRLTTDLADVIGGPLTAALYALAAAAAFGALPFLLAVTAVVGGLVLLEDFISAMVGRKAHLFDRDMLTSMTSGFIAAAGGDPSLVNNNSGGNKSIHIDHMEIKSDSPEEVGRSLFDASIIDFPYGGG